MFAARLIAVRSWEHASVLCSELVKTYESRSTLHTHARVRLALTTLLSLLSVMANAGTSDIADVVYRFSRLGKRVGAWPAHVFTV